MNPLRTSAARATRSSTCSQCLRQTSTRRSFATKGINALATRASTQAAISSRHPAPLIAVSRIQSRSYAAKSTADEILESITEQYATARDEFEIATEETEKKSVYAASDREAAREELEKLKELYEEALSGSDGEEVKRRVGQRIRELDSAVQELNKADYED
ncbi:hypothetical protein PVAG01_00889 [Phlyctema vagabunda]|uniref:Uncharacterized protein n=1 Tax=Phlyctema vagabunda TaxID=108571 RepID=A0ABR4PVJ8_9HELO